MVRQLQEDYTFAITADILQHIVWNIKAKMYQVSLQMIKRELGSSTTLPT